MPDPENSARSLLLFRLVWIVPLKDLVVVIVWGKLLVTVWETMFTNCG